MIVVEIILCLIGIFIVGYIIQQVIAEYIARKRLEREYWYLVTKETEYWRKRAIDLEEEIIKSFENKK